MQNRSVFSALGVFFLLGSAACGGGGRNAETVASAPHPEMQAYVPIQRPPAYVNSIIPRAAAEMDLSTEESPTATRQTWVLYRGMRLEMGGLYFRVDVKPVPGKPDRCIVDVMATPKDPNLLSTQETISKPSELAFRIATIALAGAAK